MKKENENVVVTNNTPSSPLWSTSPARGEEYGGFTLIELLVVVLIISILSAVAVPMYKKAVLKSRYTALMPLTKALADSNEVYYLEHGYYANNPQELSVQGGSNEPGETTLRVMDGTDLSYVQASNETSIPHARYLVYQKHSTRYAGTTMCEASDEQAAQLCQALGGQAVDYASQPGWTAYLLSGTVQGGPIGTCVAGAFSEGQTVNSSGVKCAVVCENGNCETKLTGGKEYTSSACNGVKEQYICSGNTFSGSGWCYGGFKNACAGTTYLGPKGGCVGEGYRSCSNSVFNSGANCRDTGINGSLQACIGSVFKSGSYCQVAVGYSGDTKEGCTGAIYEEGAWCEVLNNRGRCPAGSPTKNGLCWDGSGNEVDCSTLS